MSSSLVRPTARSCSSTGRASQERQIVQILLDDHVAAAGELRIVVGDRDRPQRRRALRVLGPVDEAQQIALVEGPEPVDLVDHRDKTRKPVGQSLRQLEAEIESVRTDVEEQISRRRHGVCLAPATGMKRCSRCGRGAAEYIRSHRSEPSPTTQLSSPSGIRNPTDRFRPETSASAARRASSLPVAAVPTRKIAASVNGPRMGCGCSASDGDTDAYVATAGRSVSDATRDPQPGPRQPESARRCQPLSRR